MIEILTLKIYQRSKNNISLDVDLEYREDFFKQWLKDKLNKKEKEEFIEVLEKKVIMDLKQAFKEFKENLKD
jgi:hypothetical protein